MVTLTVTISGENLYDIKGTNAAKGVDAYLLMLSINNGVFSMFTVLNVDSGGACGYDGLYLTPEATIKIALADFGGVIKSNIVTVPLSGNGGVTPPFIPTCMLTAIGAPLLLLGFLRTQVRPRMPRWFVRVYYRVNKHILSIFF